MSKSKGYIVVASVTKEFYNLAINLIDSVLEYHPQAKITLVTEEQFLDGREDVCDKVILCDSHYRAKLWGMAHTPYDITFYMDADMECVHEDIANVFDELGDRDMVFASITKDADYAYALRYMNKEAEKAKDEFYTFKHNGGCCLYDSSNPKVMTFVNEWQKKYYAQRNDYEWWPLDQDGKKDFERFPHELRYWDQFTLWWLTHMSPDYKSLNIGTFEDWPRWNYYSRFMPSKTPTTKPIVLYHYSSGANKGFQTDCERDTGLLFQ